MAKEKKDNKEFLRNKEVINIKDFMLLKSGEQDKLIEESLKNVYEGHVDVTKKHLEKVLNVAFDNKDNETYLPHNLCVKKDGNKLIFSFKKKNKALIILFLLGFLFIAGFATFTGVQFLAKEKLNIDLNGDGKADLNIDIDNNGLPDLNIDTNGDGNPDINIDDNGDGKCDRLCAYVADKKGGMTIIGGGNVDINTAALIVTFETGDDVNLSNLYPDDQNDPNVNTEVPDVKFKITNTTDQPLKYNLDWIEVENTFISGNFQTKIKSNGGYNSDWTSAPVTNNRFGFNIEIPANSTQDYTISFRLHGTGSEQNYDQGKKFKGRVAVELIEDNK